MDFYERTKMLCKERNITVEALMAACNLRRETFAKWGARKSYPRSDNLYDMSKVLNVSMEYLLMGEEKAEIPPRLQAVVDALSSDEEKLAAVETLLGLKKDGSSGRRAAL